MIEDFIPVIFQSKDQKILYSIICAKTDKFSKIEDKLYEKFPELEEGDNYQFCYTINGKVVRTKKTIADNNINYSDIVTMNKNEIN